MEQEVVLFWKDFSREDEEDHFCRDVEIYLVSKIPDRTKCCLACQLSTGKQTVLHNTNNSINPFSKFPTTTNVSTC